MKGGRRRALPYVFSPNKKLFQIVVKMKNIPRAYAAVLEILGSRVNLIGTVSYNTGDRAIFSGFAEALSPSESPGELEKALCGSPMVTDCVVTEGSKGVLVDTFHSGLETSNGEPLVMFRRNGICRMLDQVANLPNGSGEEILFNEGVAVGTSDGTEILQSWRPGLTAEGFSTLLSLFSAFGWGSASSVDRSDPQAVRIRMDDCFECSTGRAKDRSCAFVKGFLVGSAGVLLGRQAKCVERACRFKGDDHCEFVVDTGLSRLPTV